MISDISIRTKLIVTFAIMALITAITGGFGIFFTTLTGMKGSSISTELYPIGDAAMELQLSANDARLALERVISSDRTAKEDDIWKNLNQALAFCDAILFGANIDGVEIAKAEDPEIRNHLETVKSSVQSLSNSLRLRFKEIQDSIAANQEADKQYLLLYNAIQNVLTSIQNDYPSRRYRTISNLSNETKLLLTESHLSLNRGLSQNSPMLIQEAVLKLESAKANGVKLEKQIGIDLFLSREIGNLLTEANKKKELTLLNQTSFDEVRRVFNREFDIIAKRAHQAETLIVGKIEAGSNDLRNSMNNSRYLLIGITILGFALGIFLAIALSIYISKQIEQLIKSAENMAAGSLDVVPQSANEDEFGEFVKSFQKMVNALISKTKIAEQIGKGVLTEDVELSSDNDMLGKSLQNMLESLRKKTETAQAIAQGNLDFDIELSSNEDALGIAFQQMIQTLNDVLLRVSTISNELKENSEQISISSQGLSQAVNEQAASLEEISSSMEELDGQTQSNTQNAKIADQKSIESKKQAEDGYLQMQEMVSAMNEINATADQISNIIKTIDEIAFQTNVLAINAAVEAARAGEHGKGFAVVAEEVRSLAQRSADASKETTSMIKNAVKKIEKGASIAEHTAQALDTIKKDANDVKELVEKIVVSSNEQALGVSQVNQGIMQLNSVVQSNASVADQTASSAEKLDGQANILKQLVSRFRIKGQYTASTDSHSTYYSDSEKKLSFQSSAKQLTSGNVGNVQQANESRQQPYQQQEQFDENIILFEDEDLGKF